MPNIQQVQAENLNNLEGFATFSREFDNKPVQLNITAKVLAQFGAEFNLKLKELIKQRKIDASGYLSDVSNPEIIQEGASATMQIRLADYYDYVNKGVKGKNPDSRNAPNSPYFFKTYGVGKEMRENLTKYIQNNRSKIRTVTRDKAVGIGLERKGVQSPLERQVNTMGYMIKSYGIKARHYFDDAFDEVFKDFNVVMTEAIGNDIIISLTR